MDKTYQVTGMKCGNCVQKVTKALEPFADRVSVSLNPPQVQLKNARTEDLAQLNAAVAAYGNYALSGAVSETKGKSWLATYYPLFLIVSLISVVSLKGTSNIHDWMIHFMAGFFIVFGFFKFLDLKGFRDAYAGYDLLAKRWPNYGLVYPFLEIGLGMAFLFGFNLVPALWFSIVLMGFSSLGVIQAVSRKQKIRCACLGTALNLPMSTITIVEDLGMVAMSVFMLVSLS